ncbi:PDR/VanB family oxidoreductase [Mycobacterium sp. CVI_P3]|uniref:PDR/VanB family oxidoreductase n=1 Tax=Mycobacterium pinniadriaticum TaxID=2994102 RepID=A0ABT3SGZ3_9MYCO|nr:PDR/VanB family oxidoreductase [Mycobacterium pinniadriaticum]MCX2932363.1 PDR/VanB family oxidoreductase [Mycobacterium pinniadriaticum]MCX2938780.1 PDR/VanB family oxidoreductase [Mycobacterium pinniadriaticum]
MSTASVHEYTADLIVRHRGAAAEGVVVLDLVHPDGEDLPRWQPGAHIDLILADGLTRQYSLCGDPRDCTTWRIAVLLDPNTRGGSQHVHEKLHEGDAVQVRGPRNHFPLVDAGRYRFVAGGIGITPIMAMADTVERAGGEWTLLYGGRTRASMAFAEDLADRYPGRVTVWPQDEQGLLDLDALLGEPEKGTLVYCCGPEALLNAVEERCARWPEGALHIERFAAKVPTAAQQADTLTQFEVVCQRSGVTLNVTAEDSILELVEAAGIPITTSCYEGVCGSCEARVLEGVPEHRDSVLDAQQREAGEVMLICVSRSCTSKLVLDL